MSGGLLIQVCKKHSEIQFYLDHEAQEFYQLSYSNELHRISPEQEANQIKKQIQDLQKKVVNKIEQTGQPNNDLQEASRTDASEFQASEKSTDATRLISTDNNVSDLIEFNQNLEGLVAGIQSFTERIQLSQLMAEWLIGNQEMLAERIERYILVNSVEQNELYSDFQEINKYISWLWNSLRGGRPMKAELEAPLSLSANLYAEAFRLLKEELLIPELPSSAIEELYPYLDYLTDYLDSLAG
jgi:hypothetical protein